MSCLFIFLLLLNYVRCDENESIRVPKRYRNLKLNLQKVVDHHATGLNNDTRTFSYVVFTDPQLGLYDVVKGNDGTEWQYDIDNIQQFGAELSALPERPDFIICLGDLNNAYPETDPADKKIGFLSPYRPPQALDLMVALQNYMGNSIPLFMLAGNHDLTENVKFRHMDAHEKVWGNGYFYFWNGGRVFIALETQPFRSEIPETVVLRNMQIQWLKDLFKLLPKDAPKTVFQHVALFLNRVNETDSSTAKKALPLTHRNFLIELFCENNVRIVYSGHTHFNSFPKPYKCPKQKRKIRQLVLTALTAQLTWKSDSKTYPRGKPSYMIAKVNTEGKTVIEVVELGKK